jgi:hypothetical protein
VKRKEATIVEIREKKKTKRVSRDRQVSFRISVKKRIIDPHLSNLYLGYLTELT